MARREPHHSGKPPTTSADAEASPAGWGVPLGFIGALPALVPVLLTGCAACVGAGAAAGVAAVATPSSWWLLATAGVGGGVAVAVDRLRCRRCGVDRSPWRTLGVVLGLAGATYLVSIYVLGPLLVRVFEWITGPSGGGGQGPTLP